MADTRRAIRAITASNADPELVAALLSADSNADAVVSFTLLRDTIPDDDLVQLANLREVLFALPEAPFRTGEDLDLLVRSGGYEATARSYRRRFESSHGVFGLEFVGRGRQCEGIFVHTPACRMQLEPSGTYCLDPEMITLFVRHHIVLDAHHGRARLGHGDGSVRRVVLSARALPENDVGPRSDAGPYVTHDLAGCYRNEVGLQGETHSLTTGSSVPSPLKSFMKNPIQSPPACPP
jgi:hypothetical protein